MQKPSSSSRRSRRTWRACSPRFPSKTRCPRRHRLPQDRPNRRKPEYGRRRQPRTGGTHRGRNTTTTNGNRTRRSGSLKSARASHHSPRCRLGARLPELCVRSRRAADLKNANGSRAKRSHQTPSKTNLVKKAGVIRNCPHFASNSEVGLAAMMSSSERPECLSVATLSRIATSMSR
jgi:hypothetical protein